MVKVSIIVSVYNIEKFLRYCLDSIFSQTFTDFELLLVNDGSKDTSGHICDEYAKQDIRVRVFHKENGGVSSARNYGLSHAKGEWIMYVDGDDWIEPDMLEMLLQEAETTSAEVVFGNFVFAFPDHSEKYSLPDWDDDKIASLNRYINSAWTCMWGSIAKRSLYERYQLRSPQGITYCEDFHLMVRLCYYAKKIAHINLPFYHYRQLDGSVMHNLNKKTEYDEQWVYQDTISFFKKQGVYENYKQTMCCRMLKATQELVLKRQTWREFKEMIPEKKHFIFDCIFINKKLKVNMWCLTHHLEWVSGFMLILRKLRHGRL